MKKLGKTKNSLVTETIRLCPTLLCETELCLRPDLCFSCRSVLLFQHDHHYAVDFPVLVGGAYPPRWREQEQGAQVA